MGVSQQQYAIADPSVPADCPPASAVEQPALALIRKLCLALNGEGIEYCHWKSNNALDRSASGENDLDLLVSQTHAQRFTAILYRFGFKEILVPDDKEVPGILNFFGYDAESDRFVHVHAHYCLVLGHDLSKNYRLPVERAYLASAVQDGLFKVPAPEFELMIYVIRMILKHATWDAILGGQGKLSSRERKELNYLLERADRSQIDGLLKQHLPCVDSALFDDCLRALRPGCPVGQRMRTGSRVMHSLRAHARKGRIADLVFKARRRVSLAVQSRLSKGGGPRQYFSSGGAIIALVGGDGAGKTTAIDQLAKWLSAHFATRQIHLGKPALSKTTWLVFALLKLARMLGLSHEKDVPFTYSRDTASLVFPGYAFMLRAVCRARDRYHVYQRARRFASNGGLVISDRFPLPDVILMDGPQCERMTSSCKRTRLMQYLVNLEKHYYQQIMPPEQLIVLRLDPEIAVTRKSEESRDSVHMRSTEVWNANWQETRAHVIDAQQPKEVVLSQIKQLVWAEH